MVRSRFRPFMELRWFRLSVFHLLDTPLLASGDLALDCPFHWDQRDHQRVIKCCRISSNRREMMPGGGLIGQLVDSDWLIGWLASWFPRDGHILKEGVCKMIAVGHQSVSLSIIITEMSVFHQRKAKISWCDDVWWDIFCMMKIPSVDFLHVLFI